MINFQREQIMFDSLSRDFLHLRKVKEGKHLCQILNFYCLIDLRHLHKATGKCWLSKVAHCLKKQKG